MPQSQDMQSRDNQPAQSASQVRSFVVVGDSFSEGVGDPYPDGSGVRGWGDRFAERLALVSPGLRYANLAVRGKVLGEVLQEQVPLVEAMRPGLVSIAAGGNDLLRPRADPDDLAQPFDEAVARLAAASEQVMMFTGFDPGMFAVIRMIRGKAAAFNAHLRVIAARHGALLVDLWPMRILADPREWAPDRLHLSPDGHRRVALRACEVVGVPADEDWREPLPPAALAPWVAARREDAAWARTYAAPWVRRRLAGRSSGDGMLAKRPALDPLTPEALRG